MSRSSPAVSAYRSPASEPRERVAIRRTMGLWARRSVERTVGRRLRDARGAAASLERPAGRGFAVPEPGPLSRQDRVAGRGSSEDLLDDDSLRICVVLRVLPRSSGEVALGSLVERSIGRVAAQAVAKSDHALD